MQVKHLHELLHCKHFSNVN